MRKWAILALSLAWLAWELVAAFDPYPSTWPLTQVIVTYVPAYLTLPAALLLAVWLPWHFYVNYRDKRNASRESLMILPVPAPTQTRHPWRATARTVLAAGVSLLSLLPVVAATAHVDAVPAVAQVLVVTGAVTRILAMPGVDGWLRKYLPVLAAVPNRPGDAGRG